MHIVSSLEVGGLEIMVLNLLRKINRERYEPSICTFQTGGDLKKEFELMEIPIFIAERKEGWDFRLPFKLSKLLTKEKIDLIHTHNAVPWLYGGIAAKILNSKLLFHTEHANLYPEKKKLILAEKYLSNITNEIIADVKKVADYLEKEEGICPNKIKVIFNGVDVGKYESVKINTISKKRELGINEDNLIIGIVARLNKVKDHNNLLNAFRIVSQSIDEAKLLIIGDGELKQELINYSNKIGIDKKVIFLGNRRDIPELLKILDVFVLSSISEGLPLTILEAMAAGVPVIATNVGGNKEVVLHEETGLLVPERDSKELADAINIVLKNKEKANLFSINGLIRVKQYFSLDQMVKKYERLYEGHLLKR